MTEFQQLTKILYKWMFKNTVECSQMTDEFWDQLVREGDKFVEKTNDKYPELRDLVVSFIEMLDNKWRREHEGNQTLAS